MMTVNVNYDEDNGLVLLSVGLKSKFNIIPIKFVLRVPNPLKINNIYNAPFFDKFIKYENTHDTKQTLTELRVLRDEIDDYVRSYDLYCDMNHTMPMLYMLM